MIYHVQRKNLICLVLSALLILVFSSRESSGAEINEDQAVNDALVFLGLENDTVRLSVSPRLETVEDVEVWRVTISAVDGPMIFIRVPRDGSGLDRDIHITEGGKIISNPHRTSIDVILDANTGQPRKVISPPPPGTDVEKLNQIVDDAYDRIFKGNHIRETGYPSQLPDISFSEAVQYAAEKQLFTSGHMLHGRQIEAKCVEVSDIPREERRVLRPGDEHLFKFSETGGHGTIWIVGSYHLPSDAMMGGVILGKNNKRIDPQYNPEQKSVYAFSAIKVPDGEEVFDSLRRADKVH